MMNDKEQTNKTISDLIQSAINKCRIGYEIAEGELHTYSSIIEIGEATDKISSEFPDIFSSEKQIGYWQKVKLVFR